MTLYLRARALVEAIAAEARATPAGHARAALEVAAWFVRVAVRHLEGVYRTRVN